MTALSESLQDRIRGAAFNVAREYGADAEDVASMITLAILEKHVEDPAFLEQSDAYCVNLGAWRARDKLRKACSRENREIPGDEPLADDGATLLDLQPADWTWREAELQLVVRRALADLSERDREIAARYAGGWSADEIADELDCSRRTVYYRLQTHVRDALVAGGAI